MADRVWSSTYAVTKGVTDHLTTAGDTKAPTLTVRVNVGPPASMGLGVTEVTTGVELWAHATAARQARLFSDLIPSIVIGLRPTDLFTAPDGCGALRASPPGAIERDGPGRGGDQHDEADGHREGSRGNAQIERGAGQVTAGRDAQHADAEIGAEDAAAEAVLGVDLQQRAGEDPVGGTSRVRGGHGAEGDGERSGCPEADVAGGGDHEPDEDPGAQARVAFARPPPAEQRAEQDTSELQSPRQLVSR